MDPKLYKLRDWIEPNKLDWDILFRNNYHPCLLEIDYFKNKDKIFYRVIMKNPFLLEDYIKNILNNNFSYLKLSLSPLINEIWNNKEIKSKYPNLIEKLLLEEQLLENKYAIDLIEKNLHIIENWSNEINFYYSSYNNMLCLNTKAIHLIENILQYCLRGNVEYLVSILIIFPILQVLRILYAKIF